MTIKVLNEFLPEAEQVRLGGIKVGESLSINNGVLNTSQEYVSGWTNIITKITKNVIIGLANNAITVYKGTKIYIPNGFESDGTTLHFDTVTLSSDFTDTSTGNETLFLVIVKHNESSYQLACGYMGGETVLSWPANPVAYRVYYNSTENACKMHTGTNWLTLSLPLGLVVRNSSGYSSITSVFNGFGFVANSVFALPGVRGLIPSARNIDGTPAVTSFETDHVLLTTCSLNAISQYIYLSQNQLTLSQDCWYDYSNNVNRINTSIFYAAKTTGSVLCNNNTITTWCEPYIASTSINERYETEGKSAGKLTYINGNRGRAFNNSLDSAGNYTTFDKYNGSSGVLTISGYQNALLATYTAQTTVNNGVNSLTYSATLLDSSGNASFPNILTAQTFNGTAIRANWADLAEKYITDEEYPVGTVVQFGGKYEVTLAKTKVNGVISSKPGFILNSKSKGQPVALCGKVKIRVLGYLKKGDRLTLCGNGIARKKYWYEFYKQTIGIALEDKFCHSERLIECITQLKI